MKTKPCEAFHLRAHAVQPCRMLTDSGFNVAQTTDRGGLLWHPVYLCRVHMLTWAIAVRQNRAEVRA